MLYSDNELREWWRKLSKMERIDLLNLIKEKTGLFGESLCEQYADGKELSVKQLKAIRKWES